VSTAHELLSKWVYGHEGTVDEDAWEVYLTDPANTPDPVSWRTEIVQPYRTVT
jgi:effector-binding domain-containing protein